MSTASLISVGLVIVGLALRAPGLILLGVLALGTTWLSTLWSRHGLREVRYSRRLANDRAVWGDSVELDVEIENRKLLPLAWLQADDFTTDNTVLAERRLEASERPGYSLLRNVWTLAPFERVLRRFHVVASHRGVYRFESVRLSVADLFGRDVAKVEERQGATLVVRPRTVPVRGTSSTVVPVGSRRARHGLIEDPALFAGVRPFQPGDPRRRIHQRASARLGRPVSKRFEPSTARQIVIALDVQTLDEPYWLLAYEESAVEGLIVAAASLARHLLAEGAAVGLAANGWTFSLAKTAWIPPRTGADQVARIADVLGRLSSVASVPFEHLLAELPALAPSGALVITVGVRDVAPHVAPLRRLRAIGFETRHVALGSAAGLHAARARQIGLDAIVGRLEPDWRTSDALTLAG